MPAPIMPPPLMPPHGPSLWVTLLTGSGLGAVLTAAFNFWSKFKDGKDARVKTAAEALAAKEKLAADAAAAQGKLEAEALASKEARVDESVWKLIKETREHADAMRAESRGEIEAMSRRVSALTEEVALQKERAGMAEVLTSVANLRADDADADRRELKAKLSLAMVQIETLQRELEDRDGRDHRRQQELAEMRDKLLSAEQQLVALSQK